MSQLERMAFGVSYTNAKCEKLDLVCQNSFSKIWEFDFFSTAKWLTHLEEFSTLPIQIQMKLLQSVWHIFGRLYKTGKTAEFRKIQVDETNRIDLSDQYYVEIEKTGFDMSWLTNYPFEEIRHFLFGSGEEDCGSSSSKLISTMVKLELSEVELTYMTAQLCFQYASTRYSGTEISAICDRFLSIIGDDLHRYYMREDNKNKNYAGRLFQMLKINQEIQKSIRLQRDKQLIARTFDIFIVDYSHPEMFVDTGC
uniref:NR LBD domain-containing protein n=1 Tax=Caenorhabditis tropicalis TaxID=1561998 RepID=A0A1I7V235_9PELO